MLTCAAAALAVVLPREARAQAAATGGFQGNPTVATGTVSFDPRTSTSQTINVGSSTATINWSPFDSQGTGTINFLPQGHTGTFKGTAGLADFTVLNRVLPTDPSRPIALNGTIIGQLQDAAQNVTTGGKIWFSSPGGILVGSNAVINVGGLLLTANDPTSWSTSANGFTGTFTSPANSTAAVTIASGALINAPNAGSYVALIAPRVEQHGAINVNGTAAMAAAESLTMTMNQGLFDIVVSTGTGDSNGIVHTGTTGGPASTGAGDNHRIYMVAVPKNQALTLLLSGNAGFAPAVSASVENGEIVLSTGWTFRDIASRSSQIVSANTGAANLSFGSGTYTSDVFAVSRGSSWAVANESNLSFQGDLSLRSTGTSAFDAAIDVGATNGGTLSIGGNLRMQGSASPLDAVDALLYATNGGAVTVGGNATLFSTGGFNGVGGHAAIHAFDGDVSIGGAASLNAGTHIVASEDGRDATGGEISVSAHEGGSISTGDLTLNSSAVGEDHVAGGDGTGGDATGGTIWVNADSGGSITVNGDFSGEARGTGGNMRGGGSTAGGDAEGGGIDLLTGTGTIHVTGHVTLDAGATGGSLQVAASGGPQPGGDGDAGWASIWSYGPGSITVDGTTSIYANGIGGNGQAGGLGIGGSAGIGGNNGTVTLGAVINLTALGTGGDASSGFGGAGGSGIGGVAHIDAFAEPGTSEVLPSAGTIIGGNATLNTTGRGGRGGAGNGSTIAAGNGGMGQGGVYENVEEISGAYAGARAEGASLTLGNVSLVSEGYGGAGGAGGAGQAGGDGGTALGGSTQAGLYNPLENEPTGTTKYASLNLSSSAQGGAGGAGGSGAVSGDGGAAFAGGAWQNGELFMGGAVINAKGDVVVTGDVELSSNATGGSGHVGGAAAGGWSGVTAFDGGLFDIGGDLILSADATGGTGTAAGGIGIGGVAVLRVRSGGVFDTSGFLDLTAVGEGGFGGLGGQGTGGAVGLNSEGTFVNTLSITLAADGRGGNGTNGGHGNGGSVNFIAFAGGTVSAVETFATAIGSGGNGTAGNGGDGFGGTVNIGADRTAFGGSPSEAEAGVFTNSAEMNATADGEGGNATGPVGNGGAGTGGTATTLADGGTLNVGLWTDTYARGFGGNASATGTGGAATGGTATVRADGGTINYTGIEGESGFATTWIFADAFGGSGQTGGNATAGTATLRVVDGGAVVANTDPENVSAGAFDITADAEAGVGTAQNGSAFAGTASVIVDAGGFGETSASLRDLYLSASAVGDGPEADAGLVTVDVTGAALTADSISMQADSPANGGIAVLYVGSSYEQAPGVVSTDVFSAVVDGGITAGEVEIDISPGSSAYLGDATISALGGGSEPGPVTIELNGFEGQALGAASMDIDAAGDVNVLTSGATLNVDGMLSITTDGAISLQVPGEASEVGGIVAEDIFFQAGSFGSETNLAAESIWIDTVGDLYFDSLSAGTSLTLQSGGDLFAGSLSAGINVLAQAGNNLNVGSVTAGNTVSLDAGGSLNATGNLTGATVNVSAGTDLYIDDIEALDVATLNAGGTANINGVVIAPVIIVSSSDLNLEGGLGLGGITEVIELFAMSNGSPILIGDEDFAELALETGGYHLSQAEAEVIEASTVLFAGIGTGETGADVILANFVMEGSGGEGDVSNIFLNSDGNVFITGEVLFVDAGFGDTLSIAAAERIIVDTSEGGFLAMATADELPGGSLILAAQDIWVGETGLLEDLAENQNFTGRNDVLVDNPGENDPVGHLVADTMFLLVGDSLFVQNSGTANNFAGITVGEGGLTIANYGGPVGEGESLAVAAAEFAPLSVVAFGQMVNSQGEFIGGAQFFETVNFGTEGGVEYAAGSTFNNIAIGDDSPPPPPPPPPPEEEEPETPDIGGPGLILGPVETDIYIPLITAEVDLFGGGTIGWTDETEGEGEAESGGRSGVPLNNALANTGGANIRQSLDEGVTSGGDSHLWNEPEDDEDDSDEEEE